MNKKYVLLSFIGSVVAVIAIYILYQIASILWFNKQHEVAFVLVPAQLDECKGCQIEVHKDRSVVLTLKEKHKLKSVAGLEIKELERSPDKKGHQLIRIAAPNGTPDLFIVGAELKSQLDGDGLIKAGYAIPADGFGYVLMPNHSNLNGINGDMAMTWVKLKQ